MGAHVYDEKGLYCSFDRLKVIYISYNIPIFGILPAIVIGFSYMRIFHHTYKIKSRIKNTNSTSNGSSISPESIKLAKTLFISYFLYATSW